MRPAYICALLTLLLAACSTVTDQSSASGESTVGQPVKSPNDERGYRYLILPNQMRVLLVSDPTTDMAAASLAVDAGSLDDPPDHLGLAHFLEHMLFLGTEKFPDPGEYQTFISTHGGQRNAYTADTHTNYFFQIEPSQLEGALDRFSQFFIAPLFNAEYVMHEREAVNGEYRMQIRSEEWRSQAAERLAFNSDHPASQFSIGNLETLSDSPHRSLRSALTRFYREHYSANLMALVIYGRQSLDGLEALAYRYFEAVPNRKLSTTKIKAPLIRPDDLPRRLAIKSLKEQSRVWFHFPVPGLEKHYREAPARYIDNLLGHEGEGSLDAYLKSRGWIEMLAAYGDDVDPDHATISVMIELTDAGRAHVAEIGDALFDYIRRIRAEGVTPRIFDEQRRIAEISFDFQDKAPPSRYTTHVAANMLIYPADDVLRGPYRMDRFSAMLIQDYLERLNPDNLLLEVSSQSEKTTKTEHWFGVDYDLGPLPQALYQRWSNPPAVAELAIPGPNPFLPDDLSLVADAATNIPEGLSHDARLSAWLLQDTDFKVPRADIRLKLESPIAYDSAKDAVLAALYARLVEDALNTYAYPALLAGLSYSIDAHPEGLMISLSGYSDKQHVLLQRIVETIAGLVPTRERFELYRDQLRRDWENSVKDRPYPQAYAELGRLIMSPSWEPELLAQTISKVSLDELIAWKKTFLERINIEALLVGNLDDKHANALVQIARAALVGNLPAVPDRHRRVVKLVGQTPLLRDLALEHDDAVMVYYVQGTSETYAEAARYALLAHMMGPGYFDDLRTERQLGYVVFATEADMRRVPGIAFIVQSPVAPVGQLAALTTQFVQSFQQRLAQMSDDDFEAQRAGLLSQLRERDTNLSRRSSRLWADLELDVATFDSRERTAQALEALTREQFTRFYGAFLQRNQGRLIVFSQGKFHGAPLPAGKLVEGPPAFQEGRPRFDS